MKWHKHSINVAPPKDFRRRTLARHMLTIYAARQRACSILQDKLCTDTRHLIPCFKDCPACVEQCR